MLSDVFSLEKKEKCFACFYMDVYAIPLLTERGREWLNAPEQRFYSNLFDRVSLCLQLVDEMYFPITPVFFVIN